MIDEQPATRALTSNRGGNRKRDRQGSTQGTNGGGSTDVAHSDRTGGERETVGEPHAPLAGREEISRQRTPRDLDVVQGGWSRGVV